MSFAEVFSYTAFVHAISGATGGSIAMTTFYPLDVIRTHQQIKPDASVFKLINDEGIEVLYRGLRATLISLYASNFVYFYANNLLKVLLRRATKKSEVSVLMSLVIASLAGVINVLMTCPLWVANTRLKIQSKTDESERKYKGLWDCLVKMSREEGLPVLWSGVGASLILVSNPTINFVIYDKVKDLFYKNAKAKGRNLLPLEIFVAGAIAKSLATLFTYPIQLAQSRQRSGGHGRGAPPSKRNESDPHKVDARSPPSSNLLDVLWRVYLTNGIQGWYAGLDVKLLQTVLMAAFHFLCYEQIKNFIFALLSPQKKIE